MDKPMQKPKILIVDDKPENLFALEKLLKKLDADVLQATSGTEALKLSLEHDFCLLITDIQMPEMDGYEFVELLRSNQRTATLAVIFVSAIYSDEYHHRKAYDSGAVDFMSKPFIPEIMLSKVRVFMDLYEKRQNLQSLVDELYQANSALLHHNMILETSNKISQKIINILDLKELLSQMTGIIQMEFNFPWVGVWLINNLEGNMRLEACSGRGVELGITIPLSYRGLLGQAYRTKTVTLDNKAGRNGDFIASPGLPNIFSELAIPLNFNNEVLGVMDFQSDRLESFVPDDVTALHLSSMQIAVAINNAKLYSEVVRLNSDPKSPTHSKK
jgi:CheY-like chemotaxis protein